MFWGFFSGLWPIIAKFTGFGLALAGCVIFAVFIEVIAAWPPLKALGLDRVAGRARNLALVAAGAIALSLFMFASGVSSEAKRCTALRAAEKAQGIKVGTKARVGAARDVSGGVQDPRDTDK